MVSPRLIVLVSLLVAGGAAGCKRKKPDAASSSGALQVATGPDAGGARCPEAAELRKLVAEPGRVIHTGCFGFPSGTSWMALVLDHDEGTKAAPRLRLLAGGIGRPMVFDVVPLPTAELERLLGASRDVSVNIRTASSDMRLVRLGVVGALAAAGPITSEEIIVLLELGAHKPPNLLWAGAGNQITTEAGCVRERVVDFERPFGRGVNIVVGTRASGGGTDCTGGPGFQDNLPINPRPLPPGKSLQPASP